MERKNFRAGTLTAPLPAVLVSVGDAQSSNLITIGWTGILCSDPPMTYISVRKKRHSYTMLEKTREFVIHLPDENLARATDYCGIFTGAKVDKFEKCALTKVSSAVVAAPTVAEAPLALECRVREIVPLGTHDVFVADIVNVSVREDLVDAGGRICLDRAHLLAYCHGEYFALGKKIEAFGFSASKKKKKIHTGGGKTHEKRKLGDRKSPHSGTH